MEYREYQAFEFYQFYLFVCLLLYTFVLILVSRFCFALLFTVFYYSHVVSLSAKQTSISLHTVHTA